MSVPEKIHLSGVKYIVVVASGKGGVGKSTVSANLAIGLALNGNSVALLDADIYGPSIPKMFAIEKESPQVVNEQGVDLMLPITKFGVKIMSIGFFINKNQGLFWRGPMASNTIKQLFEQTKWGDTDYLIIDFPPGTGDVQMTIIQNLKVDGAIIVTTPQEIAVNDARKAASMCVNEDLKVPLIGVVENMSWFTPAKHPDEKYFIFGSGGGQTIADEYNTTLLTQIPLVAEIGQASENGTGLFNHFDENVISFFDKIVQAVEEVLN